MPQSELRDIDETNAPDSGWKGLYKLGGLTALILILVPLVEIATGFLLEAQRASANMVTVVDWFTLFHNHWFLGLRDLGFLNLVGAALLVPTILAVYSALRRDKEAYGVLGTTLFFMGITVYIASSRAFPMLSLSNQCASATTDAQRSLLASGGQAMLAERQSRAGVLLIEFACLVISTVMLRGNVFSKATACAGMLGNTLLMAVELIFVPLSSGPGMVVAACGGISIITWYLLVGRRLLQLGSL
jgi:hypothetical protein